MFVSAEDLASLLPDGLDSTSGEATFCSFPRNTLTRGIYSTLTIHNAHYKHQGRVYESGSDVQSRFCVRLVRLTLQISSFFLQHHAQKLSVKNCHKIIQLPRF